MLKPETEANALGSRAWSVLLHVGIASAAKESEKKSMSSKRILMVCV